MFRKINIKNIGENFKAELYKNRHEKIGDIPNEYIGAVKRSLEEINEFDLTIPKYVGTKGEKKINSLYLKIKPMQHIIVTTIVDGVENKERFILIDPRETRSKNSGEKSFKAMSFEYVLKKKRTSFQGKVIQLKKDDVHIAEGILDKFSRETGWGIGYVDPKSRVELMSATEKINVDLFKNYTKSTVITEGSLLFEKDIITTIADNRPLYISFEYSNFKTYDNGKLLIETPSIYNTITDALYTNIKKVQAYHYSDVGNRSGIKYVFTLTDNTKVERVAVFTNIINKTFTCENIRLVWETGDIVETENVKYINIESLDADWYETLKSLQDNFKSVFLYDGYNKTISVVHRDNLGEEKPYLLSYDNAIIDIDITENSDYVTGLKVIGKNGLSIVSENIYGDDIVRNYSDYIRLGNMSEELQSALKRYEAILTTKQQEWLRIKDNVITETQKKVRIDSEIQSLQTRIKELKNLLAGYMSEKDTSNQSRIKSEIDGLETRLNQCLSLRIGYNKNIELLNDELAVISKSIDRNIVVDSMGKIFTDNDLQELNDIEQFNYYEDDYYSNSFSLLNASKKVLEDMIKPQLDFDINCVDLCKSIKNQRGWNYILQLGSLLKFDEPELKEQLGDDTIRLVSYEYIPKTDTINKLTFTNKIYKYNIMRQVADLNKKTNTNNNILNNLRPIIDDAMLSNNFVSEVLKNGLDMSAYVAKSRSISNYLDISSAGIFISDQSDLNKSLYIGSGLICISTDGFASSKTAISPEGVFSETLWGKMIFGERLMATSDKGAFEITGDGLTIFDELKRVRVKLGLFDNGNGVRMAGLTLYDKNGRSVVLDENGILNTSQAPIIENISAGYGFEFPYVIDDGVTSLKKVMVTLIFSKYRGYTRGSSAGGSTVTTSSSGGGFSYGSTSGAGGYYYSNTSSEYSEIAPYQTYTSDNREHGDGTHNHTYYQGVLSHAHGFTIEVPSHSHYFSISQPNHAHSVSLQNHEHAEIHGIYVDENSGVQNAKIYVNDVLVAQNINSDKFQFDITTYLKLNNTNYIKITNEKNVRVCVNLFEKKFVSW